MWKEWVKFSALGILLLASLAASAQGGSVRPKLNSPYSRFGLGDPVNQYFGAQAGMAGLSAATITPEHLNVLNPASLAYQGLTSLEVGVFARFSSLKTPQSQSNLWSGNLNYLALGFPLKNPVNQQMEGLYRPFNWGMSFTLAPYTFTGYNVVEEVDVEGIGQTTSEFKGNGGSYRLMWGNGFRYKNFSFGFNVGYLFGKLTNNRRVEFDSLDNAYGTEFLDDISISGFTWNAGVMYNWVIGHNKNGFPTRQITFGAYGQSGNRFNTNSSRFLWRDNVSLLQVDTILFEQEVEERGRLPFELTVGATYEQIRKLKLGAEVYYGGWSSYFIEAKGEGNLPGSDAQPGTVAFEDNWKVSLGAEYVPDFQALGNYMAKVRYRLGAFYGTDPRVIQGQSLSTYGMTLGMGFPVLLPRKPASYINFAVEVGHFGNADVLRETYVNMTLGFTLNDNSWFFKRKFN